MLCYFFLVKALPPATVSLTTFLTPALALVWGAWINGERFTTVTVLGMAVIIAGLGMYFGRDVRAMRAGA
jgi:drug/metabolite transporter (DMT)-like permease